MFLSGIFKTTQGLADAHKGFRKVLKNKNKTRFIVCRFTSGTEEFQRDGTVEPT